MKEYKIYTCGKMKGLSFEQQMQWRKHIQKLVEDRTDKKVNFIHPPLFFNYDFTSHKDEEEVMKWELNQVCKSDIVVVGIEDINDSIGSHIEIGAALGANITGGRQINIIGVGNISKTPHPWINSSLLRYEESYEDAADYIVNYLLV